MSLEDLRKQIDDVDARITKLIGERIRIAEEIGRGKRAKGWSIEDRERERRVLENVRRIARQQNIGIDGEGLEDIYERIIAVCKNKFAIGVDQSDVDRKRVIYVRIGNEGGDLKID